MPTTRSSGASVRTAGSIPSTAAWRREVVRTAHRLLAWQRRVLYGGGVLLLATGIAWLAVHYGRPSDALPSALEPWAMRLHGLASFAVVFTFGALAASHIPQGWRWTHRLRWAQQ